MFQNYVTLLKFIFTNFLLNYIKQIIPNINKVISISDLYIVILFYSEILKLNILFVK
jgi:hypothetical protein